TTPAQYVKGVGPRIAETLAAKGIQTLEDLLFYLPFRYEDRLNPRTIAELRPGEMASVIAEVRTSFLFRTCNRMPLFEMTAGQGRRKASRLRDGFAASSVTRWSSSCRRSLRGRGVCRKLCPPRFGSGWRCYRWENRCGKCIGRRRRPALPS